MPTERVTLCGFKFSLGFQANTNIYSTMRERATRVSVLETRRYHELTSPLLIIGESSQLENQKKKRHKGDTSFGRKVPNIYSDRHISKFCRELH